MKTPLIPPLVSQGQVLAEVNGCLGLITLNRPHALNALSLAMVRDIGSLLRHWLDHAAVQAVVIDGAQREGKAPAFCAGGDIRFFHQAAMAGDPALSDFFIQEYALNHLIHNYPKPYIALMDGICMGGGMGISQGAKLRVVNENSKLGMPETRIGFFPDVGGGYFLGQCPGSTGEWLALTGQTLLAGDAISLGLADVFVPSPAWHGVLKALRETPQPSAEHVVATVMECVELAPEVEQLHERDRIDHCFGQANLNAVVSALKSDGSSWATHTLNQLAGNSPTAMELSLRLVRLGRKLSLADELRLELNLVHRCFESASSGRHSETLEGIRALAIDKDHLPVWQPAGVEEIGPEVVEHFFSQVWTPEAHPLRSLR
ncbi:MAG: enoyl-CoA hydratase/isomerase family protein [Burkholderiales bacterium]